MVGVLADVVHNVYQNFYEQAKALTAAESFDIGLGYLHRGVPDKAREHITDAVTRGHVSSRSYLYLLLALLSGRTLQQVEKSEFELLRSLRSKLEDQAGDSWSQAIRAINDLLATLVKEDLDPQAVNDRLKEVHPERREEILRHLDIFLNGPILDGLWTRTSDSANENRFENNRLERAWKFFHPEPAGARARLPMPSRVTFGDRARAYAYTGVGTWCLLWLVVVAWQSNWSAAVVGLLLFAGGARLAVLDLSEWRSAQPRKTVGFSRLPRVAAPAGGFANKVDRKLDQLFAKYAQEDITRAVWLEETQDARSVLRDEIVEIYRDERTSADEVAWLIEHLVAGIRARWEKGTLRDSGEPRAVPFSRKALVACGAVAVLVGTAIMTWSAIHIRPVTGLLDTTVLLACVWAAVGRWSFIRAERRRAEAETAKYKAVMADRLAAYERWKQQLADRPNDTEMAEWLDHDRKALLAEAMTRWKLTARDIVAHTFIERPLRPYERARLADGPWRYSRYRIQVLLLTSDGVRQIGMSLEFLNGEIRPGVRFSYQYDKVVSAKVQPVFGRMTFELTLVNGDPIKITVADEDADLPEVTELTLDAAGLGNTLHLLEGIAAEGKRWIGNERAREREKVKELAEAARVIFDGPSSDPPMSTV